MLHSPSSNRCKFTVRGVFRLRILTLHTPLCCVSLGLAFDPPACVSLRSPSSSVPTILESTRRPLFTDIHSPFHSTLQCFSILKVLGHTPCLFCPHSLRAELHILYPLFCSLAMFLILHARYHRLFIPGITVRPKLYSHETWDRECILHHLQHIRTALQRTTSRTVASWSPKCFIRSFAFACVYQLTN